MIPFLFALTFSILVTFVFIILGLFLFFRWISIFGNDNFNIGEMKVPTFYSTKSEGYDKIAYLLCMPVVGVVFGGIHCIGWFFNIPSSGEAILWRVSSALLTGTAYLLPLLIFLFVSISKTDRFEKFPATVFTIILLVYVVSRILLLVEAFISLRHLTSGMLESVRWTSFIPHI